MSTTQSAARRQSFFRTYKFRRGEKDPVIDKVRTIMDDTGSSIGDINKECGVASSTLRGWFDGETMRPQYATLCATVRSMGYDFALVPAKSKANGHDWDASGPRIMKRFGSARAAT